MRRPRQYLALTAMLAALAASGPGISGFATAAAHAQAVAEAQRSVQRSAEEIRSLEADGQYVELALEERLDRDRQALRLATVEMVGAIENGNLDRLHRELRAGLDLDGVLGAVDRALTQRVGRAIVAAGDRTLSRRFFLAVPPENWEEEAITAVLDHGELEWLMLAPEMAAHRALLAESREALRVLLVHGNGLPDEAWREPTERLQLLLEVLPRAEDLYAPFRGDLLRSLGGVAIERADIALLRRAMLQWGPLPGGNEPLCLAALGADCVDCVRFLVSLDRKQSPSRSDDELSNCAAEKLMESAVRGDNSIRGIRAPDVLEAMIASGMDLGEHLQWILGQRNRRLARRALVQDDLLPAAALAEGYDLDARDDEGRTALIQAIESPDPEKFSRTGLFLVAGADANAPDSRGVTPLEYAARLGRVDLVWALRDHGAENPDDDPRARRLAATLWDAHESAPRTLEAERLGVPVIELLAPAGLTLYEQPEHGRGSIRYYGSCCAGMTTSIETDQDHRPFRGVLARLWFSPPVRTEDVSGQAGDFTVDGLEIAASRDRALYAIVEGMRGSHRVEVRIKASRSMAAEARELARRTFDSLRVESPVSSGAIAKVVLVAVLGALALFLTAMSVLNRARRGAGATGRR